MIGHDSQIDIYKNPENTGFVRYMKWFAEDDSCAVWELKKNDRGWISEHADNLKYV